MIASQKIDRICLAAAALAVLIALALSAAARFAPEPPPKASPGISDGYVQRLFDDSRLHTIDIEVSDSSWGYMTAHAMEEQYVLCSAVIDGERIENVAIRPKGNSSLAAIAKQGSDRFSFKIEFDRYRAGNTYHGLDKLALNNLGQDVSCMKDYLSYTMMQAMGVPAPLCAYALVRLNGEDFGLYLAVEAIEDSFAARCFGNWTGNLYRPDVYAIESIKPEMFLHLPIEALAREAETLGPGDRADVMGPIINTAFAGLEEAVRISAGGYAGDDPGAYGIVFDTAVFDVTPEQRARYVDAVRRLNGQDAPESALDIPSLAAYFAVHNFVNNYDSYTGLFSHNYYLCENEGKLSFVPWDYNLGFGAFSVESAYNGFVRDSKWYAPLAMGAAMSSDKSFVNYPIDTPTISAKLEERPLLSRLLESEEGLSAYHEACARLLERYFSDGYYRRTVERIDAMIAPYVAKGLAFYSDEQYALARQMLLRYGEMRAESVRGQLDGRIPATLEGQSADYAQLVEIGDLDLGRTIDFGGLAFGITSKEVCAILDAVFAEETDVDALSASLQADPSKILPLALRVVRASPLISGALLEAAAPPLLLILCVALLLIALRRVKRKRRDASCS